MHREAATARRRRRSYKSAHSNTAPSDLQSTQHLIPEEEDEEDGELQGDREEEEEEETDIVNGERSHLLRPGDSPTISPHNSASKSSSSGGDTAAAGSSNSSCTPPGLPTAVFTVEEEKKKPQKQQQHQQEGIVLDDELVVDQQHSQFYSTAAASSSPASKPQLSLRTPPQQTPPQQQQQPQPARRHPLLHRVHASSVQQLQLHQQQQFQQQSDSNMTIPSATALVSPPPVSPGNLSSSSGGGGGSGSGSTNIRRGTANTTTGVTRAFSFPFTTTPSTTTISAIAGVRTPVTRKRTRFHQRSLTMAAATTTSPSLIQPGSMTPAEEMGLLEKARHLDLAATYHGGGTPHSRHKGRSSNHHHHHTSSSSSSKSSTPSMLFTKVKERIREKVFQSSEWPSAAAMIQEKRQRANDMLEASLNSRTNLNIEQIQYHEKQRKKTTTLRSKSDSGKYSPCASTSQGLYGEPSMVGACGSNTQDPGGGGNPGDKEVAKQAFRRRSISEDTYDRPSTSIVMKKNGVVCSNEDLDVIMQEQHSIQHSRAYKNKRSPRPLKKHLRTQSLDMARLTARENNQQGATSSGSIYLDPQVSMASSSSTVSSIRTIDSETESDMNARSTDHLDAAQLVLAAVTRSGEASPIAGLYPEIVLDDRSKETIMEETSNEQTTDNDEEEIMEGGKKKPKPIPEVIFDENGQTWDVYGADFDPEVLGMAIQRHLEKMMERMMASAASPPLQEEGENSEGKISPASMSEQTQVESKRDSTSFWLRLLCLFAGRNDVGGT